MMNVSGNEDYGSFIFKLGEYHKYIVFTNKEQTILLICYITLGLISIMFNTPFIYVLTFKKKFHTSSYLTYLSLFYSSYLINVVVLLNIVQLLYKPLQTNTSFQAASRYLLITYFTGTTESLCMISIYRAKTVRFRFDTSRKKVLLAWLFVVCTSALAPLVVAAIAFTVNFTALGVIMICAIVVFFGAMNIAYFSIVYELKKSTKNLQKMKSLNSRQKIDDKRKKQIQRLGWNINRIMFTFLLTNVMLLVRAGFVIEESLSPAYLEDNLRLIATVDATGEMLALFGSVLHPLIYCSRDSDLFTVIQGLPLIKHLVRRLSSLNNELKLNTMPNNKN